MTEVTWDMLANNQNKLATLSQNLTRELKNRNDLMRGGMETCTQCKHYLKGARDTVIPQVPR